MLHEIRSNNQPVVLLDDYSQLRGLARKHVLNEELSDELDRAIVVPLERMPADVVTMHSRLRVSEAGAQHELIVCYPVDADPNAGRVSVLSPVVCLYAMARRRQTPMSVTRTSS